MKTRKTLFTVTVFCYGFPSITKFMLEADLKIEKVNSFSQETRITSTINGSLQ